MDDSNNKSVASIWKYIYGIGGLAALILALIFFIALIELMTGSFELFQTNFILRLIQLHAEYSTQLEEAMRVVNLLDILILTLVGILAFTLYPVLKKISKIGAIITVFQPILGIILFLITQQIGRTTTFTTSLTISVILLSSDEFDKNTVYLGTLAAVLLLIPDISFSFTYSNIMAIMMSLGYLLIIPWFVLMGLRLCQLARGFPRIDH
ncbi:MAG: hypothetical protein ACFFCQ_18155 [Promethearchaeota archaeon]